ncbi:HAD-IC family P-type ATPase, partial [Candidatus Micrarchaeota archaeon]|nr:HAD-IC family P-type ATPase [Candidatus Micrarchaeota archaeon]
MRSKNNWHSASQKKVFKLLSSRESGLTEIEAAERIKKYGPNELKEAKRITVLDIFLRQFRSLVVAILLVAAVLSFLMHELLEMAVIFGVLIFNAVVGTVQEYSSEKAMEALKKMSALSARIIRDGKQRTIPAAQVVPGDLILLETGDKIAADSRIIQQMNLSINESMLTGESTPVQKKSDALPSEIALAERTNMAYKDSIVVSGRAKAVVVATGMSTEIGKVAGILQKTKEVTTPLQNRISDFMRLLGKSVFFGVILVISVGFFIAHLELAEVLRLAVAQAVSFIPEGLPVVVTIVLAIG